MKEISGAEIPEERLNRRQQLSYDCLETVTPQGDGPHQRRLLP